MQFTISPATIYDLETILQLQKECYLVEAELYNEYRIPPLIQNIQELEEEFKNAVILKATVGNDIVASVRAFSKEGTCYIGRLMVRNDFQNKGLGQQMMNAIESKFSDCLRFELFTGFKSYKNLYLYTKLGYKDFKTEKISEDVSLTFLSKNNKH